VRIQTEDMLELALCELDAAVAVVSPSREVLMETATCERLLGMPLAAITPEVFLRYCHADDVAGGAHPALDGNGEVRWWVNESWRRIKVAQVAATPQGAVLVISDVTSSRSMMDRADAIRALLDASVELGRDGSVVSETLGMGANERHAFAATMRVIGEEGYVTAGGRLWRSTVQSLPSGAIVALYNTAEADLSLRRDALWRRVVESLSEGVFLFSADGNVIECNSAALALIGMSRREVIGEPLWDVAPELAVMQTRSNLVTWVRDGQGRHLECSRSRLRLGDADSSTVLIVRDVTTENELTEALELERKMLFEVNEELRAVVAAIANTRGRERAAIARRIHDDPIQRLAALRWRLTGADPTAAAELEACYEALRQVVFDLRPQALMERGLGAALVEMEELDNRVAVSASGVDDVDPEIADLVWRNVREAVRNSITHSRATTIEVAVGRSGEMVVCEVKDNGQGVSAEELHAAERRGHIGVASVRETVTEAGGAFYVLGVETGTTVRMEVPGRWRTL
jgi:PAS domain S-box-containing protein